MVLKKKMAVMCATSAIAVMALVGCSSTDGGSSSGGNGKEGKALEVLANKDARQAIAMSLDRKGMCDTILNNGTIPASYFVAEKLAFNEAGKDYRELAGNMGYEHNDKEATKLWEKAKEEVGFDKVTLELLTFDSETSKRTAEFMQSELQGALPGLTVEIKTQPFKQKNDLETKGEFELSYAAWNPDYPDPLTYLETMESGLQYAKHTNYKNENYDKLIEEAKNAESQDKSWEKYAEAEKLMLDDAYIVPTVQQGSSYLQKPYVSGRLTPSFGVNAIYNWVQLGEGKKELNITNTSDISTLDISKVSDSVSSEVLMNTMEGLVKQDKDGKLAPGVAEKWEKSEDGKSWTFHLRKNAKWSNGDPVTAKDFEYSWKRTLDPATASTYGFIMYDIVGAKDYNLGKTDNADKVGVKAVDEYTLKVDLVRPVHYFDSLMFHGSFLPQNKKAVEKFGDEYGTTADKMVYNGPFTLSNWKIEDMHTMSKNPNYWDASNVKIDKVNVKIVKDPNAALNLYETGSIDIAALTSENVDKYKDSPEFKTRLTASVTFFQINGGKGASK
ncbi:ABC transporter substrate-binding protein [Paraclostridium ghonii]|uniref:ABC transporter substrate-binding protein n=1 Tax=Paraclostridium ghonii TaxID=29358 RepID=UPI00202CD995|nr:ABC transporter substrate-binding protein [Paeniclostridium ghonii]MCM0166920.1 ABC transporter substrate-binding protein [Paeniclostridium ghonii]